MSRKKTDPDIEAVREMRAQLRREFSEQPTPMERLRYLVTTANAIGGVTADDLLAFIMHDAPITKRPDVVVPTQDKETVQ